MTSHAAQLAGCIDHSILKPEATADQVDLIVDEALEWGFFGVCVNPVHVRRVSARLERAGPSLGGKRRPAIITVAGFPLGAGRSDVKADEAARGMDDGAVEIDMVADIGALIEGDGRAVRSDIEAVARAVHQRKGILKVIIEAGVLNADQLVLACRCCAEGEADFVKTSTGFHACGGATVEQVRRIHRLASPLKVKASGGIRTLDAALTLIDAGAARLGTSSGVAILTELSQRNS